MSEQQNSLISAEKINPLQVFTTEGIDPLLEEIERQVKEFEPDLTTATGRKEIASMANKVARSKTLLDGMGKDLVADWKAKAKVVDDSRKKLRDRLDQLKAEVRAPLTKWEDDEKDRIEYHKSNIAYIENLYMVTEGYNSEGLEQKLNELKAFDPETFEEFESDAAKKILLGSDILQSKIQSAKKYEAEQAELERLRREEEERKKREHEEKLKAEAAEKARKEEAERQESARKAEEKKAKEAEEKRIKAEQWPKEVEEKAKREKEEAEERRKQAEVQAKKDAELAALKERQRIEEEQRREREEAEKRERNRKHKAKIHNEIMADLINKTGIDGEETIKSVITAIAKGDVRHVSIKY